MPLQARQTGAVCPSLPLPQVLAVICALRPTRRFSCHAPRVVTSNLLLELLILEVINERYA